MLFFRDATTSVGLDDGVGMAGERHEAARSAGRRATLRARWRRRSDVPGGVPRRCGAAVDLPVVVEGEPALGERLHVRVLGACDGQPAALGDLLDASRRAAPTGGYAIRMSSMPASSMTCASCSVATVTPIGAGRDLSAGDLPRLVRLHVRPQHAAEGADALGHVRDVAVEPRLVEQ